MVMVRGSTNHLKSLCILSVGANRTMTTPFLFSILLCVTFTNKNKRNERWTWGRIETDWLWFMLLLSSRTQQPQSNGDCRKRSLIKANQWQRHPPKFCCCWWFRLCGIRQHDSSNVFCVDGLCACTQAPAKTPDESDTSLLRSTNKKIVNAIFARQIYSFSWKWEWDVWSWRRHRLCIMYYLKQ